MRNMCPACQQPVQVQSRGPGDYTVHDCGVILARDLVGLLRMATPLQLQQLATGDREGYNDLIQVQYGVMRRIRASRRPAPI